MAYDDDLGDDSSDERDAFGLFGEFGEFGVTSDELPAVRPWRSAWAAEQRARTLSMDKIHRLYEQRVLSSPAYDLLQLEFHDGLVPVVEYNERQGWRVWSANEQRWYLLATWERKAQEYLAIDDPDRVTSAYQTPLIAPLGVLPPLPDGMGQAAPPTRFVEPPEWQKPHWQVPWGREFVSSVPGAPPHPMPRPRRTAPPPPPAQRRRWWQW